MTPPPTLQELIDTVRQDAGTEDPISQLAVAAAAASDLEQTTDALLGHFVDRCRRAGRSWSEISAALGVTKQAVHKRFAGPLAERLIEAAGQPTLKRFTTRARSALAAAYAAAKASGHREVGTGHLLLGLYAEPEGLAAKALLGMSVSREQIAAALDEAWAHAVSARDEPAQPAQPAQPAGPAVVPGDTTSAAAAAVPGLDAGEGDRARQPMSPGARTALLDALTIALEFGHNYIGTEHILLGLYRNPDSLAARVLADAGADESEAQVRIREMLRGPATPGRPPSGA